MSRTRFTSIEKRAGAADKNWAVTGPMSRVAWSNLPNTADRALGDESQTTERELNGVVPRRADAYIVCRDIVAGIRKKRHPSTDSVPQCRIEESHHRRRKGLSDAQPNEGCSGGPHDRSRSSHTAGRDRASDFDRYPVL